MVTATRQRKYSSMKEKPSLMSLPAELRELIWIFALAEDDPLAAYLGKRTVRRPPEVKHVYRPTETLMRQWKRNPENPPLTHVSRQIRKETVPIFFRENIFAFAITDEHSREVPEWPFTFGRTVECYLVGYVMDLWTVRAEFTISGISDEPNMEDWDEVATVDMKIDAERKLQLKFGGVLAKECTCEMVVEAGLMDGALHRGDWPHDLISDFVARLEIEIEANWSMSNRRNWRRRCGECGKMCAEHDSRACTLEVRGYAW